MTDPVQLKPFVHRGMVLMHCNGVDFEMAPVQLFISEGGPALRIGRNVIFFEPDGSIDGSECKAAPYLEKPAQDKLMQDLNDAYSQQGKNRHRAPHHPYFEQGSNGWRKEVGAWSNVKNLDELTASAEPSSAPKMVHLQPDTSGIINAFSAILKQMAESGVPDEVLVNSLQHLAASGTVAKLLMSRDEFTERMELLYDSAVTAVANGAMVTH